MSSHLVPVTFTEQVEPLDLSIRGKMKPLTVSSETAMRGGRSRRRYLVPPATTLSESCTLLKSSGRQRRVKRPRYDPNFVTGEHLDLEKYDHGRGAKERQVTAAPPVKRRKVATATTSKAAKSKSCQSKKAPKSSVKVEPKEEVDKGKEDEATKVVETGETVILELKCPEADCGEMLPNREAFNRHLLYMHFKFPYSCLAVNCKKEFEIMGELGPHVRDFHTGQKYWPCAHCGRDFPTHRGLRHHLWYYHLEGRFACPLPSCGFEASLPIYIKQHRYREHSPLYICEVDICGRVFKQRSNLVRHGRTHTGIKPYCCTYPLVNVEKKPEMGACTYSSEVRSHVIRHIRARHLRQSSKIVKCRATDHGHYTATDQSADVEPEKYLLVV